MLTFRYLFCLVGMFCFSAQADQIWANESADKRPYFEHRGCRLARDLGIVLSDHHWLDSAKPFSDASK